MSDTRYRITTTTGHVFSGYVQGCGGYLREEVRGLKRLRKLAAEPGLLSRHLPEPSPGCVAMDCGTSREVFVEWTYEQRMANRHAVPIAGATIEIER